MGVLPLCGARCPGVYAHMDKMPICVLPNLVVWLYGIMSILPHLGTNSFTTNQHNGFKICLFICHIK